MLSFEEETEIVIASISFHCLSASSSECLRVWPFLSDARNKKTSASEIDSLFFDISNVYEGRMVYIKSPTRGLLLSLFVSHFIKTLILIRYVISHRLIIASFKHINISKKVTVCVSSN